MAERGMGEGVDALEPVDAEQLSFEQLVAALEALTDRLASGQIGIEEAADLYEQAERLHGLASQRLARVQARIEALGAGTLPPASTLQPTSALPPASTPRPPGA